MTMTLEPTTDAHLDDFEFEATLARMRAYVDQLTQADDQADAGSLQRAADLAALYEDERWVKEWLAKKPIKAKKRPGDFQAQPDSKPRFYEWAKERITSPTTGDNLSPNASKRLLDTDEVATSVRRGGLTLPDGVGIKTLTPLVTLIKNGREGDVPRVWRDALERSGGDSPGKAKVKDAVSDYKKAVGWKTVAGKKTIESREARIEQDFDWLVTHTAPDRAKALLLRLAKRQVAEKEYVRGEAS